MADYERWYQKENWRHTHTDYIKENKLKSWVQKQISICIKLWKLICTGSKYIDSRTSLISQDTKISITIVKLEASLT